MSYDLPWANASNTPFRLYKHWVHEGGIATPMIAYWPAAIPAPQINHAQIHVIDLMATFLDIAGVDYPQEYNGHDIQPLEGESFAPVLRGQTWERERPILWEHEGNCAVRDGRWKLVSKYPGDWELYDMIQDRTELNDLSQANKPQVEKMVRTYQEWTERCGIIPWKELQERLKRGR
jgi:arylsulfatase